MPQTLGGDAAAYKYSSAAKPHVKKKVEEVLFAQKRLVLKAPRAGHPASLRSEPKATYCIVHRSGCSPPPFPVERAAWSMDLSPRLRVLLFGDSLTQRGFAPGGWAARLADACQRCVRVRVCVRVRACACACACAWGGAGCGAAVEGCPGTFFGWRSSARHAAPGSLRRAVCGWLMQPAAAVSRVLLTVSRLPPPTSQPRRRVQPRPERLQHALGGAGSGQRAARRGVRGWRGGYSRAARPAHALLWRQRRGAAGAQGRGQQPLDKGGASRARLRAQRRCFPSVQLQGLPERRGWRGVG